MISAKVTAATGAAAVTSIVVWLLTLAGAEVPTEVQGAITTLLVLSAGYLVPEKKAEGKHAAD